MPATEVAEMPCFRRRAGTAATITAASRSSSARECFLASEGRPLLLADWDQVVFLHFEIAPELLQPHVPFVLDQFAGRAYVSLVAFTMRRLRFARGGRLTDWLSRAVGSPRLLNLRTYVRAGGEPGICFLTEWISDWRHAVIGPALYGLPYRWARVDYEHQPAAGWWRGSVRERGGERALVYEARDEHRTANTEFRASKEDPDHDGASMTGEPCPSGSLDEFLLERYTAFTRLGRRDRFFRVWHPPWRQRRLDAVVLDDSLLRSSASWWRAARLAGAHSSPGVREVWMGRPRFGPR